MEDQDSFPESKVKQNTNFEKKRDKLAREYYGNRYRDLCSRRKRIIDSVMAVRENTKTNRMKK